MDCPARAPTWPLIQARMGTQHHRPHSRPRTMESWQEFQEAPKSILLKPECIHCPQNNPVSQSRLGRERGELTAWSGCSDLLAVSPLSVLESTPSSS